jgi:hypothetical protein
MSTCFDQPSSLLLCMEMNNVILNFFRITAWTAAFFFGVIFVVASLYFSIIFLLKIGNDAYLTVGVFLALVFWSNVLSRIFIVIANNS